MTNREKTIKPEKPGGFQDFLPSDYIARKQMLETIEEVFTCFGFDPIETPRIEFYKTLSGEESDTGKQIFKLKSEEESESLALAFDHTVPLARIIAENPYNAKLKKGIELPWRRISLAPVFRGEKPQAGRYRQFYQFDADIVGSSSMIADAEIINMTSKAISKLGVENFVIKINNRKILNGLADIAEIKDRKKVSRDDIIKEMFRILDKIEKIGTEAVLEKLKQEPETESSPAPNLSKEAIEKVRSYLELEGNNKELLENSKEIFKGVAIAEEGIKELSQILGFLESSGISEDLVKIDFSIARGLDYYTGPVMETFLLDAPEFGSIASGGRYDDLITRFTGKKLPAVGVSIGIDRLFAVLDHLKLLDRVKTTLTDVMILRLAKDKDEEYLKMANQVRNVNRNCEVSLLEDTTFKSQFNYALRKGVRYIIICGEEEFKNNKIQIKDTIERDQKEINKDDLVDFFL